MSCLNLSLPPPKKAWKSFTSKLQTKLHKLQKSKHIKKTRTTSPRPPVVFRPSNLIIRGKRRVFLPSRALIFRHKRRLLFKKENAPVYVDKLFKGGVDEEEGEKYMCVKEEKIMKGVGEEGEIGGTSRELGEGEADGGGCSADEMWESLALASPQMYGIDERAEEFIASFRAEMEVQEMIARAL